MSSGSRFPIPKRRSRRCSRRSDRAPELAAEQAVVGFCGGPFTVAGYLVEGKPSREFADEALMYGEPQVWHALMEKLAGRSARTSPRRPAPAPTSCSCSTRGSARSRRPTTWSSSRPGRRGSSRRRVDVPTIHFGTGTDAALDVAAAGGDVIGLDWRDPARRRLGAVGATAACRATSTRPSCSGRGSASRRRRTTSSPRRRPPGPHLQPRPRRAARDRTQPCSDG